MDSDTALTTPTTAFVTDWTRLACRLSPAIQSIRRPARLTVITFRFMSDHNDLYLLQLQALNEGISQVQDIKNGFHAALEAADIEDFTWHDLHTFASWLRTARTVAPRRQAMWPRAFSGA